MRQKSKINFEQWTFRIAGIGLLLSMGHAVAAGADNRVTIPLTDAEHAYILNNMRLHLSDVQLIVQALAAADAAAAEEAANRLGSHAFKTNEKRPPDLLKKLPPEFLTMTAGFHRSFDGVAEGIKSGQSSGKTLQSLATAMQGCVACHATFRIVPGLP